MLTAVLAVGLLNAQAPAPVPRVAVVISRRVAVSRDLADRLARQVVDALKAGGKAEVMEFDQAEKKLAAAGVPDPSSCLAKRPCLAKLGASLGTPVLVGVDVGALSKDLAISVEAVSSDDGSRLAQRSFLVRASEARVAVPGQLAPFVAATLDALPRPAEPAPPLAPPPPNPLPQARLQPPPAPTDEPRLVTTSPRPEALSAPLLVSSPPQVSRTPSYLAGGAAIVLAGAALALAVDGRLTANSIPANDEAAAGWTHSRAVAEARRANGELGGALGAAAGAAALTALAVTLWPSAATGDSERR